MRAFLGGLYERGGWRRVIAWGAIGIEGAVRVFFMLTVLVLLGSVSQGPNPPNMP
jgi:hypothetical protein